MKKTMKTLLALMAGVMTFSACSNENILSDENPTNNSEPKGVRSFTAYTESDPATRATIDGYDVKWEEGDAITVFGNNSKKYTLTDGAGTTSGKFDIQEGDGVEGTDFYAIYPANDGERNVTEAEAWSIASNYVTEEIFEEVKQDPTLKNIDNEVKTKWESKIDVNNRNWIQKVLQSATLPAYEMAGGMIKNGFLPIVQKVAKGQVVDPKAVLMVAQADENKNLKFKNVCAYIKVTTTKPCEKIVVIANGGEPISGSFNVEVPSATTEGTSIFGPSVVTLQAKEGNLAANTYYIAVLPCTLGRGLSVKFYTTDEYYTESNTNEEFKFERNKVYNGGEQPDADLGKNGTEKAIIGGHEVDMKWVQLWAGGPRFAEENLWKEGDNNLGSQITFAEATKVGSEYIWGANWYTPSMEEMDELMKAAQGETNAKVTCQYGKTDKGYGFTFTGKEDYLDNSVFFPCVVNGTEDSGEVCYGSTSVNSYGWLEMKLYYGHGKLDCMWQEYNKNDYCYIRPVLRR